MQTPADAAQNRTRRRRRERGDFKETHTPTHPAKSVRFPTSCPIFIILFYFLYLLCELFFLPRTKEPRLYILFVPGTRVRACYVSFISMRCHHPLPQRAIYKRNVKFEIMIFSFFFKYFFHKYKKIKQMKTTNDGTESKY